MRKKTALTLSERLNVALAQQAGIVNVFSDAAATMEENAKTQAQIAEEARLTAAMYANIQIDANLASAKSGKVAEAIRVNFLGE